MTRYEIKDGHLYIAYGCESAFGDELTEYFLSVQDVRLGISAKYTMEINQTLKELWKNETGHFFMVHSGDFGLGKKVPKEAMVGIMEAFGAKAEHVEAARAGKTF